MKKILSFLLSVALMAGLLSGCGEKSEDASAPMGRYIEEQGEVIESLYQARGLRCTDTGEFTFYGSLDDPKTDMATWHRYRLAEGGTLQIDDPAGFAEISQNGLGSVSEGLDGTIYVLYYNDASAVQVAVSRGGGAFEDILVADIAVPDGPATEDNDDSVSAARSFYAGVNDGAEMQQPLRSPSGILALDSGDFLLCYGPDGAARYSGADGSRMTEYPGWAVGSSAAAYGDTLLLLSPDYSELWSYELSTGKKTGTRDYDKLNFTTTVAMDAEGLYLADSSGISRQATDGSIWERLVEGDLTSLIMPNLSISGLTGDGSGGFYAVLCEETGGQLMHYVYSEETPTNPDTELTIFSLRENNTVRQTIGEFQRRNPNVRVNFRIGLADESAATAEDVIRALNTEFLSGKGPDLVVLDGLPVDSYIEKGVLADISDLVGGMGDLMPNLMGTFARDGKLYGAPSRFTFPYMMGKTSDVAQITSLDALLARVETDQGQTPQFLRPSNSLWDDTQSGILMDYYDVCASEWRKEDGSIDQAGLAKYLTAAAALNSKMREHTSQAEGQQAIMMTSVIGGSGNGFETVDYGPMDLKDGKALFHTQVMSGAFGLHNCFSNLSKLEDMSLDTLFGSDVYFPGGGVAITAGGKQQELARSFMEMLLSQTVQDKFLYDGYPVNRKSLEKLVTDALKDNAAQTSDFLSLCDGLSTPAVIDQVVKSAVQSQMKDLLSGSVTPDQAAANIVEKTQLYLAEAK